MNVLFYYLGGYAGITISGYCFITGGWVAVVILGTSVLLLPFCTGLLEMKNEKRHP